MRSWMALVLAGLTAAASACGRPLLRQYEYEEEIFLSVDGSATVVVNSSINALVALAGLDLDPNPRSRFDRQRIAAAYASPATRVLRVSRPWRRDGRRFVQVRLEVDDAGRLAEAAPFAAATYRLDRGGGEVRYRQSMGRAAAARAPGFEAAAGWTGSELVAVRVHVPGRIRFHNVRRLEDGEPGQVERGNILAWEQRLADRLGGAPLDADVRFDAASLLWATLWVFAIATALAMLAFAALIWWAVRRRRTTDTRTDN